MNIGKTGMEGEKRAANFLRKNGFSIVKRNYHTRYGEIDIIAENERFILFVEVKTRKIDSMVSGVESVDSFKQRRIMLTANDYIVKTQCEKQPRFDIAQVTVFEKEDGSAGYKLKYIENAW
ncbi:MAG: YraN family protein [Ruminococcaceae bacterium]|nr:YraN family protein [Oscillospiraceae bacterium]